MFNEEKFKLILVTLIVISLLFYHLTNYFSPVETNFLIIYKIGQSVVMIAFVFITIYSKFFSKWVLTKILGDIYVAGEYTGESAYHFDREKIKTVSTEEKLLKLLNKFHIKQNFFTTKISGQSFSVPDNQVVSIWHGSLFRSEENSLYFVVDLSSESGEFGILKLAFNDSNVNGFYYSGSNDTKYTFKFYAQKISD